MQKKHEKHMHGTMTSLRNEKCTTCVTNNDMSIYNLKFQNQTITLENQHKQMAYYFFVKLVMNMHAYTLRCSSSMNTCYYYCKLSLVTLT